MSGTLADAFHDARAFVQKSKLRRWAGKPFRHGFGFFWSYLCYPLLGKSLSVHCWIFTGDRMYVPLPAGLELYLTGVKSHDSELRLAQYILSQIKSGDSVVDAGAHIGYYSIVLAACVGTSGKVIAFEPGQTVSEFLKRNTAPKSQVCVQQVMLSDMQGELPFYEFPLLYSEYNSGIKDTHHGIPYRERAVKTTTLDIYCQEHEVQPVFIKVDVEGGELQVLKGAAQTLVSTKSVAIEIRKDDFDRLYAPVLDLLRDSGFAPFRINHDGTLTVLSDLKTYISELALESDNIVFQKEPA